MKKYTHDWFSGNCLSLYSLLNDKVDVPNLKFLEIGCFEGLSTNWFLDNILTNKTSKIYCIDTFEGGKEHKQKKLDLSELYQTFLSNIDDKKEQVEVFRGDSREALRLQKITKEKFDFIYVDGAHHSKQVLEDAVLSWELLKDGGIMVFDDYHWENNNKRPADAPKISIDSFLQCYQDYIEVIYTNYQVAIRKKENNQNEAI